jgi:hypothetical protein
MWLAFSTDGSHEHKLDIGGKMNLKKLVQNTINEWMAKNATEEAIERRVAGLLNSQRDDIIAKMAGFDNHWRKWEVDHCNGRMSPVSRFIEETARDAVHKWIEENIGSLPKMNEEMVKSLQADYKRTYLSIIKRRLENAAMNNADRDFNAVLDQCVEETDLSEIEVILPSEKQLPDWE